MTKVLLSESVDGQQILVDSTGSAIPTAVHTADSFIDEVWLYAYNTSNSEVSCSILWGGTNEASDIVTVSLTPTTGRVLVVDGKVLQNFLTISAFAEVQNVVILDGFVNRMV